MTTLQQLEKQKAELEAQIESARKAQKSGAIAHVRELVRSNGLTVKDIFPKFGKEDAQPPQKVEAKYRDPSSGQTWTGRGKTPSWISGDKSHFLINKED